LPRIRLISMGGTIAFRDAPGGAIPALHGAELAAEVRSGVDLDPVDLANISSIALTLEDLRRLVVEIDRSRRGGYEGIVVAHGTDTMEESAYLAALTLQRDSVPIVFTGAMRHQDAPGHDGPANLQDAIAVACSPQAPPVGPVVVMNGQIHTARFVTKGHTTNLAAFISGSAGPVGEVSEGRCSLWFAPSYQDYVAPLPQGALPAVVIVPAALGLGPEPLEFAVSRGVAGIVLHGLGGGHVPPSWLPAIDAAIASRVTVVAASRCGSGTTLLRTYGVPGTEIDLQRRGVIMAGHLGSAKARLRLAVTLAAGLDPEAAFPVQP
jgi:L-asparaginase